MFAAGWQLTTLVLIRLIGSVTSSPIITQAPHLQSQISPPSPSPTNHLPPFWSFPSPPLAKGSCNLQISPATLVVRFGDPATANCSKPSTGYSMLGWINSPWTNFWFCALMSTQEVLEPTGGNFLIWQMDSITNWSVNLICYALADQGGQCSSSLSLIVYQPPKTVSIRFLNHSGPMNAGHQYSVQCTVQDVAPVENLVVTFYKGQTTLGRLHSNRTTEKTPVNESFALPITPAREDNGSQYWCEAKLELGPSGPQHPLVVMSQNLSAIVSWNQEPIYPTKEHREETPPNFEVKTNLQPLDGRATTNGCRGWFPLIVPLAFLIKP